jgi:hypothetical protein
MGFQTQDPTNSGVVLGIGVSSTAAGTTGGISLATGQAAVTQATGSTLSLGNPVVLILLVALAFIVFKD